MAKKNHAKKALISSLLALFICFTMLIGTTFAWFTDSAVSANNVIKSGNLDIKVEYTLDGEHWYNLDGAEDLFKDVLWEPGHTRVVALKIKNAGNLALKYAANMNIVNETIGKTKDGANIVLSDILTVDSIIMDTGAMGDVMLGVAFGDESTLQYTNTASFKNANVLGTDEMLLPGTSKYLIVKIDMPETVGNEANHNGTDVPEITFGINVLAAQFTSESDSFDNQYDKDAAYPELVPTITDLAGLREAMANGGEYKLGANINVGPNELLYTPDGGHSDGSAFLIKADTVLDLNGYNIVVDAPGYAADVFFVNGGHNFTVKGNGTVTADCGIFVAYDAATTINIEGGNYKCTTNNDMLYAIWGKLNVSGGTYETAYWNLINIYGQGNISLVDVSGGSFKNWNPASSPDGNLLADGYKSVSEVIDGVTWYKVVPE